VLVHGAAVQGELEVLIHGDAVRGELEVLVHGAAVRGECWYMAAPSSAARAAPGALISRASCARAASPAVGARRFRKS
jgi:hypothetical protein